MRALSPTFQAQPYKIAPQKPAAQPKFGCETILSPCEAVVGVGIYLTKGCFKGLKKFDAKLAEYDSCNFTQTQESEHPKPVKASKRSDGAIARLPKDKGDSSSKNGPSFAGRNPFAVF